jgi:hypothetical protein
MKKILSLLTAFAIGFPFCSAAADLVVGTISCNEWVEDRTTDTNYINKSVDQSWVMGFLSAYAETTGTNFLAHVNPQSIYSWMDKYCANHPRKKIDDAALILAHQLMQQMKSKSTTN